MVNKLKYEGHVSTGMYSYIGFTDAATPEEAARAYREIEGAMKPTPINALPKKEFDEVLDNYLTTGQIPNGADLYAQMSPLQQEVLQIIKRSKKRTNK